MSTRIGAAVLALLAAAALAQEPAVPPPVASDSGSPSCPDRPSGADARARTGRRSIGPASIDPRSRAPLEEAARAWGHEATAFRAEIDEIIRGEVERRRRSLTEGYERAIRDLEVLERDEREAAIRRFEEFLDRHPDDPRFTADAMFRLAELYYERANEEFERATAEYREQAKRALAEGRDPPPEPLKSYAPSIGLYQQLITGFPEYRFAHAMYYLLGYCLAEMGQGEEAQAAYRTLVARYPDSPFAPEAWVRLGDWYFDEVSADSLGKAADAFGRVYAYPEHPLFARAIYKLGWTYFRMDDFARAVESFTRLLDHYVAAARTAGAAPGGDVWPEAVHYIAVSFAQQGGAGVSRARAWFQSIGRRSYEPEIYARLGDVYLEETKYAAAVEAYQEVLAAAPLSPDAPRIQARIALAWSRDRQPDLEAREREVLVRSYAEGSPWWRRNAGDPDLLAVVRDLVEDSLVRASRFHHARAQALQEEGSVEAAAAEYRVAAGGYGEYLERFPHSRRAYELAYQRADCLYGAGELAAAARAYASVRDDPADDRFESEAALSAVIAQEHEVERLQRNGELPARAESRSAEGEEAAVVRPETIPGPLQYLVEDSDVLLARHPGHERAPLIAYAAAEVVYRYGHLDEARCRLEEVVARWPASEVAKLAANLVVESHLAVRDWAGVERAAARLQASQAASDPELRASLQKFKLGGRFKRATQLMQERAWEEAAKVFLSLVEEEPRHEFADEALYDAASCLESAGRFEGALRLYDRLAVDYPEAALADDALFRVGYNAESAYDFEKAVDRYVTLVERHPGSRHRKDALYNAARALENLQRYPEAAAAFARYASLYPDADDAPRTLFHAARIRRKAGDRAGEVSALQELVRRFSRSSDQELLVQAYLDVALAQEQRGDKASARRSYEAAVAEFDRRGLRTETHPRAAAAAAEARFRLADHDLEHYDRIALPATTDTRKLKKALEAKLAEARKLAPQYDDVMRFKRPDWTLAAFYRKAFLLERLAQTIYDAPVPPEFRRRGAEEYLAAYQDALAQAAQPYEDQAVDVYVQALEAARRLHVKNEWTRKIAESLARYRPKEYPVMKEAKVRLVTEDLSPSRVAVSLEGERGLGAARSAGAAPAPGVNP